MIIQDFYTAFQQKDIKGMQACYAPNATFSDPVFQNLNYDETCQMWAMLVTAGKDLELTFSDIEAYGTSGAAKWQAAYTFSATKRKVVNRISAQFELKEGKIYKHTDHFNFYRWAQQAFGPTGYLIGWTLFSRKKCSTPLGRASTNSCSAMNIRRLAADEPFPLDLLLEADPDAEKVRSYCESGQIWVMETQATLGVCVLKIKDGSLSTAEIMNIAIDPECKGKGLGKQLLSFIINEAQRQGFKRLIVATGNSSIGQLAFYQKAGFDMLRIDRHYFSENYAEPIFENGIQCLHRILFERKLT